MKPKKNASALRTVAVKISLTTDEFESLQRAADAAGAPLAVWVRMMAIAAAGARG